ncbi:MAG: hypothetical protein PVH55_02255 [Desulfobacterales bacterium]|jgi:hypothetical protein
MNYSALKKIIFLLAIALFLFSFGACRTNRGPIGFEWEQGVGYGYCYDVKETKNEKPLPNTPAHEYRTKYQYRYSPTQTVWGETSKTTPWQHIESRYALIKYKTLEDLERFNDSIDYLPSKRWLNNLFSFLDPKDPIASVKQKVDALFERVQQLLDTSMCKGKVVINIYSNKKSFCDVRKRMLGDDCHFRAWYIFDRNTIYINVDDVHDGILAHEIAHVIIDHYLTIRPSTAIAEIIAVYVDENLYN